MTHPPHHERVLVKLGGTFRLSYFYGFRIHGRSRRRATLSFSWCVPRGLGSEVKTQKGRQFTPVPTDGTEWVTSGRHVNGVNGAGWKMCRQTRVVESVLLSARGRDRRVSSRTE